MRTIKGNIKALTSDFANTTIDFTLYNIYEKELKASDINNKTQVKTSTLSDENGNFSIDLYEAKQSDINMFYKVSFAKNEEFSPRVPCTRKDIKIFVQKGVKNKNFLKLLSPFPNLTMFYEVKNKKIYFYDSLEKLFEEFFINENIFVNTNEKNILKEYINYADNKRNSKIMKKLDNYLGSL